MQRVSVLRFQGGHLKGVPVFLAALAASALIGLLALGAGSAKADPLTSVSVDDVATVTWSGPSVGVTGNNLGGGSVAAVGDLNGDGVSDVAVMSSDGVAVLFTPRSGYGRDLSTTDLPAKSGYLVRTSGNRTAIADIGDQNGDGVPDLAIGDGANFERVMVIYGVSDPATLPDCPTGTSKCIDATDPSTMPLSVGYVLEGDSYFGMSLDGVEDFTGEGSADFAIGAPLDGSVYVIKGGFAPTSSPVDVSILSSADALTIEGSQPGGWAGAVVSGLGDINGDGFGDLYVNEPSFSGSNPGLSYVIYGGDALPDPIDLASFDGSQGLILDPPLLTPLSATNVGDVDGDGRPDIAVGGYGLTSSDGSAAILYGPASGTATPIPVVTPTPEEGYMVLPGDSATQFGTSPTNAGDLNGDGIPDQIFAGKDATANGNSKAGAATLVFGQRPSPTDPVTVGPDLTPEVGVALVGSNANDHLGAGVASLGDIDGDGLPDYAVAASGAQQLYLVPGSSLIGQAKTGQAGSVSTDSATLGGYGITNARGAVAYFEYGTSDSYGEQTSDENLAGSKSVNADVTGLTPDTEYHYRAVVVNDLGLKAYGADRTFTTAALPVDRCDQDSTLPGCPDYTGEMFCQDNPDDAVCQGESGPKAPRLTRPILAQKNVRIKRGKQGRVKVSVVNTGNAVAKGVKVCANAPKRFVKVRKCVRIGQLKAGAVASRNFKVKVKRKARKGKKITLRLRANAQGLTAKVAKANIRVR